MPPPKATIRAAPAPPVRAASVVRALARVAACIPLKPAATEHAAPVTKHKAVAGLIFQASRPATITTKIARIEYSFRRNAIAPAWMSSEISCIVSLPGDFRVMTT